jgi:hypothetical protein
MGVDAQPISKAQAVALTTNFTEDEVRKVVWGLNANGCLRLDSFSMYFYKEFWQLLKNDVMDVITEFAMAN